MTNPYDTASERMSVLPPSLKFKGELSADEDLLIQGTIEGTIHHTQRVTVCEEACRQVSLPRRVRQSARQHPRALRLPGRRLALQRRHRHGQQERRPAGPAYRRQSGACSQVKAFEPEHSWNEMEISHAQLRI